MIWRGGSYCYHPNSHELWNTEVADTYWGGGVIICSQRGFRPPFNLYEAEEVTWAKFRDKYSFIRACMEYLYDSIVILLWRKRLDDI